MKSTISVTGIGGYDILPVRLKSVSTKTRLLIFSCLVIAVLSMAWNKTASATLIKVNYEGTVTTVDSELSGTFSINDAVSGMIIYDTATSAPGGTSPKTYPDVIQSFSLTIGGYTGSSTTGQINVYNDDATFGDAAGFQSFSDFTGASVGGLNLTRLQLYLNTKTALNTLLDLDIPSVSDLNALWGVNIAAGNME